MNKIRRHKNAFTFVEILIAIFIIGVGVLPVLVLFLSGTRQVESGGNIFQVSVIAQNLMDSVRSDSFIWQQAMPFKLEIGGQYQVNPNDDNRLYFPKDFIQKYKANIVISIDEAKGQLVLDTGEPETNLYQIDVVIDWMENGVKKNYSLTNYRANTNSQTMKTSTRFE